MNLVIFLNLLVISIIAFAIRKRTDIQPLIYWTAFLFKLSCAIGLGWVYQYYYHTGDTWLFLEDASKLADLAREDSSKYLRFLLTSDDSMAIWKVLYNREVRSVFFIKIVSVLCWTSHNNYWVCAAWLAVISFFSSLYFYIRLIKFYKDMSLAAAIAIFYFPSVIFWSSGLEKETLALSGIYFLSGSLLQFLKNKKGKIWEWGLCLVFVFIVWDLKYYWAAVFYSVCTTTVLFILLLKRFQYSFWKRLFLWTVIYIVLSFTVSLLHPNFYISRFLEVLVGNHNDFIKISHPDGLIHYYQLAANWSSIITNAPWALISGIFRPFLFEIKGIPGILASLENTFILVLCISSLRRAKRPGDQTDELLVISIITYVVILCVFLSLSTPNLGSLSRYRVGFIPFLVLLLCYRNPLLGYLSSLIRGKLSKNRINF